MTHAILLLEVINMINSIDYEKEMICDLFFNQVRNLTMKTAQAAKRR
ncbi:MAG: hypothetical protein ACOCQX_03080 [Candidatus Nanoarchaeia archaeon]